MTIKPRIRALAPLLVWAVLVPLSASAQSLSGLWDATVTVNGVDVPFRMQLSGSGTHVQGSFFNGDEKVTSHSGRIENGNLVLSFDQYAATLTATLANGTLEGKYVRTRGFYPFKAVKFTPEPMSDKGVPSIAGLWRIPTKSSKGEGAWRLIVRQSGAEVSAAILRVDGDTGALTGTYRNGTFVLGHFDGARPTLLEITPAKDGTLDLRQNKKMELKAIREDQAKAQGVPEPADPSRFTVAKDPTQPFKFSYPELDGSGKMLTQDDPRIKGHVVILSITGSWCPNCHDEAPFLVELYKKYHAKGLEIVGFAFEEAEQLKDPTRLHVFIKQYGMTYPFVLVGEPEQLAEKLPQLTNLNSFPTAIFLGRDGLVKAVHAGFAGKVTGSFNAEGQKEVTAEVERLLAQSPASTR